jgi:predicted acetyltransferase
MYRNGRLVTQCVLYPLRIANGAGGMIAAGGVATAPTPSEERRRGYVERLLRAVCDELRSQNVPLSMLAAFRVSFYRCYGWRDDAGQGRSYIIFSAEHGKRGRVVRCREMVALDPQARAQIFAFFPAFADQCAEVVCNALADAPVQMLMPDSQEYTMELGSILQTVDVAQALEAYVFPRDVAGRVTLRIVDDWLEHNSAVPQLEIEGDMAWATRLKDRRCRCAL